MSSLRSRLARLPSSPSAPESGLRSRAIETQGELPEPLFPPSSPKPPPRAEQSSERGATLDDLRARMQAILARTTLPEKHEPPRVDVPELPFCVEQTPEGPLHVRTLHLTGAHRVGRISACSARRAKSELLALLALDPKLASCNLQDALYLDTETTGLGPGAGTVAFLVGLAFLGEQGGLVVEQLLVRQLGEEGPVLERVAMRLRQASMLITFNGKSFDMPVLRTRFVMGRKEIPPEPPHLDLLHVARRLHKSRKGAGGNRFGATLGGIERDVLGFTRENDVPSGEVSACYLHFLRTNDPRALIGVVEHNAWDVVSMAALVGLYGEPLEGTQLEAEDLVGVARTLSRAGEKELAHEIANAAIAKGATSEGTLARAEIAKARGDKARALADFESLAETVDDPKVRLELAKLYEHHAKDVKRALEVASAGTSEKDARQAHRIARLEGKLGKRGKQAKQGKQEKTGTSRKLW